MTRSRCRRSGRAARALRLDFDFRGHAGLGGGAARAAAGASRELGDLVLDPRRVGVERSRGQARRRVRRERLVGRPPGIPARSRLAAHPPQEAPFLLRLGAGGAEGDPPRRRDRDRRHGARGRPRMDRARRSHACRRSRAPPARLPAPVAGASSLPGFGPGGRWTATARHPGAARPAAPPWLAARSRRAARVRRSDDSLGARPRAPLRGRDLGRRRRMDRVSRSVEPRAAAVTTSTFPRRNRAGSGCAWSPRAVGPTGLRNRGRSSSGRWPGPESPNAFFEAVAREAPRGTFPRAFSGEQSYWTVVGVSGDTESALLSEDGAVEPSQGSFSVEPFPLRGAGPLAGADVRAEHRSRTETFRFRVSRLDGRAAHSRSPRSASGRRRTAPRRSTSATVLGTRARRAAARGSFSPSAPSRSIRPRSS